MENLYTYLDRGWQLLPLINNDKRPSTKNGYKDASNRREQIEEWYSRFPEANWGVATGKTSGIIIIDIDRKHGKDGLNELKQFAKEHSLPTLPKTLWAKTPSDGLHLYYKYPDSGLPTKHLDAIDLQSDGAYCLLPPSALPNGVYAWGEESPVANLPDEWLKFFQEYKPARPETENDLVSSSGRLKARKIYTKTTAVKAYNTLLDDFRKAEPGNRNNSLFKAACGAIAFAPALKSESAIKGDLLQICAEIGYSDGREIEATISSGFGRIPESDRHVIINTDFPPNVFGDETEHMLDDICDVYQTSRSLAVAGLFGLASALTMGRTEIEVKPDHHEPGYLWIASVAPSGAGKTPITKFFFSAVEQLEEANYRQWVDDYQRYTAELAFRSKKSKSEELTPAPQKPKRKQLYIDDTTEEALGFTLSNNPYGICVKSDELSGFLSGMGRYTNSSDSFCKRLLTAWSGGPWNTNRRDTEKCFYTPLARLAFYGNIQPSIVKDCFGKQTKLSGFFQRWCFFASGVTKPVRFSNRGVSRRTRTTLNRIVANLVFSEAPETPVVMKMTDEANQAYEAWFNTINDLGFGYGVESLYYSVVQKATANCARIALLLHLIENGHIGEISEKTVRAAITVTEYLIGTSLLYGGDNLTPNIALVVENILKGDAEKIRSNAHRVTSSRVLEAVRTACPSVSDKTITDGLTQLGCTQYRTKDHRGWVIPESVL